MRLNTWRSARAALHIGKLPCAMTAGKIVVFAIDPYAPECGFAHLLEPSIVPTSER